MPLRKPSYWIRFWIAFGTGFCVLGMFILVWAEEGLDRACNDMKRYVKER